jgi:hypothetical protein
MVTSVMHTTRQKVGVVERVEQPLLVELVQLDKVGEIGGSGSRGALFLLLRTICFHGGFRTVAYIAGVGTGDCIVSSSHRKEAKMGT